MLHRAFDMRQVGDYRDLMIITKEQAVDIFNSAIQFTNTIEGKLAQDDWL